MNKTLINGNMLIELDKLEENSIDAVVTDPPYELNFMNKGWDNSGISYQKETWGKCLRVLKPGGYLLAFAAPRTQHRIACAIEDGGFEIRDTIMWVYGQGFAKSMNIGTALDKKLGVDSIVSGVKPGHEDFVNRQTNGHMNYSTDDGGFHRPWMENSEKSESYHYAKTPTSEIGLKFKGFGSALKPAYEPIIMARKPLIGTVAENVIEYGVGGINIDECRVPFENTQNPATNPLYRVQNGYKSKCGSDTEPSAYTLKKEPMDMNVNAQGRFPANLILTYDDTDFDEVCGEFPENKSSGVKPYERSNRDMVCYGRMCNKSTSYLPGDGGSASRYFYCAKASKRDRNEGLKTGKNIHTTVKPVSLMQYLVRLVSPKGAIILDPFMGSGSTGKAVAYENKDRDANYSFVGIELCKEYFDIAEQRIAFAENDNTPLEREEKKDTEKKETENDSVKKQRLF